MDIETIDRAVVPEDAIILDIETIDRAVVPEDAIILDIETIDRAVSLRAQYFGYRDNR